MIGPLGHLAIMAALVVAAAGSLASFAGGRTGDHALIAVGRRGVYITAALVTAAVILMLTALVTHDFAVKYVADVGSRETPLYYTVISLWAALEGSILFWVFLLSLYTVAFLLTTRRFPTLLPYATGVLLAISAFFLFVIAGPGNPFAAVHPVPADGAGPNPLLQNNWMMGVHPPLLYLGYVGLSVPYAVSVAALLRGTAGSDVLRLIRRWALVPWVFLTLGIVAGMWWSYAVLGWGGYWSWDPVENASVMPWLVTTAFLHSLQVQERRRMLGTWTLSLIVTAFLLSILGTFLTRSGVLASVHSFTQSGVGPLFLVLFSAVLVSSIVLLTLRGGTLDAPGVLDAALCRESAFLVNNLFFIALTFTILLGTMFPLLVQALQGSQLSVGAPYFDHVAVPIGIAVLFLMGVGPVLPWGASRLDVLQYRLLPPVAAGTLAIILLLVLGVRGVSALIAFGLAAFVLAVTLGRVAGDIRTRRGNTSESWVGAGARLLALNPRRYGGYLVHLGVILVIVGITASGSYQLQGNATLRPGESASIGAYRLTYLHLVPHGESNRMVLGASVRVARAGRDLGTLTPSLNYYKNQSQPVPDPAIRSTFAGSPLSDGEQLLRGRNPFEDLYLVLQGFTVNRRHPARSAVALQVYVNPLVGCIWLGGGVMGIGGLLAMLPARRRRTAREMPVPAAEEAAV